MPTSRPSAAITRCASCPCRRSGSGPLGQQADRRGRRRGAGRESELALGLSKPKPKLVDQGVPLLPRRCSRAGRACSVSGRRSPSTMYGGLSGWLLTWIAGAAVADRGQLGQPLAVDRDRLGPAVHSPSTSIARSSSRTCWVTSPSGASSTVIRTPGPSTGTKPVARLQALDARRDACSSAAALRQRGARGRCSRCAAARSGPAASATVSAARLDLADQAGAARVPRRGVARGLHRRRRDQHAEHGHHRGRDLTRPAGGRRPGRGCGRGGLGAADGDAAW